MYRVKLYKNGLLQAEWSYADGESLRAEKLYGDPRYALVVEHEDEPKPEQDNLAVDPRCFEKGFPEQDSQPSYQVASKEYGTWEDPNNQS